MLQLLRQYKWFYSLYNLWHPRLLKHNLEVYKKIGLKKNYFSPISSLDFKGKVLPEPPVPPLDQRLADTAVWPLLSNETRQALLDFDHQGFAILPSYFSGEQVDLANQEVQRLEESGKGKFNAAGKMMFAFHQSEHLAHMGGHTHMIELLSALMGREAVLFQSINFLKGSQQPTHSDSIHMTTFPLGNLIAIWVALEDIQPGSGELHYYPGSHRLPYYMNADYDNEGTRWKIGPKPYTAYEAMLAEKIQAFGLTKHRFLPKKGDVLIWHANLLHGGEPVTEPLASRKSVVYHYFGKGVVCYHEITQRPALIGKTTV